MVETKFDSRETALLIRGRYVQLKKENVDLGTLHLANCVSLATRVRADVLRAMADKLNGGKKLGYFVSSYNSRPVLHFKNSGQDRALTFVDAVEKYGHMLKEEDLGHAYRRCGKSFKGQLGQHFVLLKDQPQVHQVQQGGRHQQQQQRQQQVQVRGGFRTPGRGRGGGRGGARTSEQRSGNSNPNNTSKKRKHDDEESIPNQNPGGHGSGFAGVRTGERGGRGAGTRRGTGAGWN